MELSKQQKVIDRKFAYNTGKLPGFEDGFASQKQSGYPIYKEQISPYQMMKESLNGKSFIGSDFDTKIQQGSGYVSDDPYIKNPNLEATSKISKKLDIANIQTAASAAPGLIGSIANSWTNYDDVDEIIAQAKPMQMSKNGIGYQGRYFTAKDGKLPGYRSGTVGNIAGATASGASMGSVAGPWGAVIGGAVGLVGSTLGEIFSSGQQERNERNAKNWVHAQNMGAMDDAYTKYLQLDYAKNYGDTRSQMLYGHQDGKLASATGLVNGEPTARVSNGEVIANKTLGTMYRVPGIKNNKDGKLAALNNSDTVITNKYGLSDYAWQTGDIEGAENMMRMLTNPGYKCGKLPKHAEGWLGNAIPSALGAIASLGQYLDARQNRPYLPNTYAVNPYEGEALSTLAGLRINPYPVMQQLRNAEARTNRAISSAGGLSGAQRTSARLAGLYGTQSNIANMLSNIQAQNNAYKSKYADAAINAGQASRAARMSANQWDLDMYARAHAARNKGMQTGIANMLAQIQQYQANEFKRRQFNDTMQLYRDDMDQRKKNFEWMQNQSTRGIGADPATNNLTTPLYGGQNSTYFGMKDPLGTEDWLQKYRSQYNAWRNSLPASLRYKGGIG